MTSLRRLGNKGQISQVFLFLMAIIILVATVYIGSKFVTILLGTSCDVSNIEFREDLQRGMEAHSVYGSRATLKISAPCNARQLCIVDVMEEGNAEFTSEFPSITNVVRAGVKENIFLILENGVSSVGYDERIIVNRDPADPGGGELCIEARRGEFSFVVEGFGRFIRVNP